MPTINPIDAAILTAPEPAPASKRPPMVVGGSFQGTGAQLTIWANEYNARITAKETPHHAAAHAARTMFLRCTMHDLGQLGYYTPLADDPGNPGGFGFQPGQLFPMPPSGPIPAGVFTGLQLAIAIISEIPSFYAQVLAAVLELIELILDIVNWIASLFAGKPVYVDTQLVATRFLSGRNPASFVPGIQLLRNMSQNSIYLSSSNAADQTILGDIRRQAEEMIVAQGELTADQAKALISLVWDSANQPDFILPSYLKLPPPSTQPPPPPPTCPPGYHYDPTLNQCVPDNAPPPPPGQPPCPPFTQLPDCLPIEPPPSPDNDTPADLMAALNYWLQIIAIYLMNLFQAIAFAPSSGGGSGGGGNPDPVTCQQLTGLVGNVTTELAAIATAIEAEPSGGGGQPVDLSHVDAWADQETGDETATAANLATLDSTLAGAIAAKLQTS